MAASAIRPSLSGALLALACTLLLAACSTTKHVPQGAYLLDRADIVFEGEAPEATRGELANYLRQSPNHKVLGFLKLQLATYNLSGRDSTRWYNRWLRRMGQPPAIYSPALTEASRRQLELALLNRGYMDAKVSVDTVAHPSRRKIDVVYTVDAGAPHRIASLEHDIADTLIASFIDASAEPPAIRPGGRFDRDALDAERARIARILRNNGYFDFSKEYVAFYADTLAGSKDVDLTMVVRPYAKADSAAAASPDGSHPRYTVRDVVFVANYRQGEPLARALASATDSVRFRGMDFLYDRNDRWLTPGTLEEKCFITPGQPFRAFQVDQTYEYLSRLGMIRSINIDLVPVPPVDGRPALDAYILLTRAKKQALTFDVEGTNSEGDLGFGVGLTYQHRNLGHRSRRLTVKFRANYESISGNLEGFINNNYQEYAGEVGIAFPKFAFPFISPLFRKRIKASTEAVATFNFQRRPEYTRIIAGATWRYKWGDRVNTTRRNLDLLNINYVYLPSKTIDFLDQIAPSNPLLRYSYEDHFIVDVAYSFYHTNRRLPLTGATATQQRLSLQPLVYTVRASVEEAGNLMYAISQLAHVRRTDGVYKLFGIAWSQYVKAEADYSLVRNFSPRHSLAFRAGAGIGIPFGNSRALPFEKRFYAGGANGVRGWSVRSLGPGAFDGRNSVTDFINQCGDISLILSAEYRAKLFWVLEGALFLDMGNVWTIRDYENQPGGLFRFDRFWKQIAGAYGIGLRFDFNYFLLRLDLGLKAYNPAENQQRWPLVHPNWHRDATFHFAVGYPF